jgi:adenylate cyclase class IV
MGLLSGITGLLPGKRKPLEHKLKWKLPEQRLCAPVADADKTVALLEKKVRAKFVGGGSYAEVVHAKQYAEGVYAYIMVRTDRRTEEETVVSDGYMIQEEDIHLGMDVTSAFKIDENLQSMGYRQAFSRDLKAWRFSYFELFATVFDITDFGQLVEIAIPATNFEHARERAEKRAKDLLAKLSVKDQDVIPTDVTTLQLMRSEAGATREPAE